MNICDYIGGCAPKGLNPIVRSSLVSCLSRNNEIILSGVVLINSAIGDCCMQSVELEIVLFFVGDSL